MVCVCAVLYIQSLYRGDDHDGDGGGRDRGGHDVLHAALATPLQRKHYSQE